MKYAIATAPKRDSRHWEPSTVTWSEICDWVKTPNDHKEAGNYLLGTLRKTSVTHGKAKCNNFHRRKDAVVSRSVISLDIDHADASFAEMVELAFPNAALMHTTYSSSPDAPRYRLLVPTDRELTPDEYVVAATSIMQMLGTEQFDPGSLQPERYMFMPAAQEAVWFQSWEIEGDLLDVDHLLSHFKEDLSEKPVPLSRFKRDPFEIEGVVGAFNKAYEDWDLLIKEYDLPYDKVNDNRYQLVGASSEAGMGPVAGVAGLVYSHHANDPAYGVTCSAFDLVRLHLFGELDEGAKAQTPINKLPSHVAMLDRSSTDFRVTAQLVGEDFAEETEDRAEKQSWKLKLRLAARTGKFIDCIGNWDLIRENDPVFSMLRYNELALCPEVAGDLPWRKVSKLNNTFSESDRWEITFYLEREYGFRPPKQLMDSMVDITASRNRVSPVRDYLESVSWDRKARVETCLPGVKPTPFTRKVARMVMAAAVARMMDPGCKWDHTLVLDGPEGLGKSWWIERISRGYSSSLGRIDNKDTLLTMQRSWIMTSDEGHSMRKADADAMKEFLTRTSDVFRMPYDRETLIHPRHCVIWSTTNDETFLRQQEGNRRFLIVQCEKKVDFDAFTDEYVDQLWAEAVHMYRAGECLYMKDDDAKIAAVERERFVEEDALAGALEEYLNMLVPQDWWDKSREARIAWMSDRAQGFEAEGTERIERTCSRQIWEEALRTNHEPRRNDLLDITEALKRIPGWRSVHGRTRIPGYGPQLTFVRDDLL